MRSPGKGAAGLAVAAMLSLPALAAAVPPAVTSIYPLRQRVDVPATTQIRIWLDQAVDASTVDAVSFRVFGRWSGPAAGTFAVDGSKVVFTPDEPFFAGEWVTVSIGRGLKNLSGEPLARGYAWNFWIKSAPGTLDLTYQGRVTVRQSGESWVQVYGAYAADLDNDGWSDLATPCEQTHDVRIFMNSGAGVFSGFSKRAVPGGATPSPVEGGDFNNDGEIDFVVGNVSNSNVSVLFGDGTGAFPTGTFYSVGGTGASIRGVGVLDLNGDGWDDIVSAQRFGNNLAIWINNGDGTFASPVLKEAGASEFSIGIADANNDGLLDVFVGCFSSPYDIVPMLSDGNGDLIAQTAVAGGGPPWQLVVGDFNGDGDIDVAVCNTSQNRLAVLLGDGEGGLAAPYTKPVGGFPLAIDTGDLDGDGDLDLVTSNYTSGTWTIYENTGATFANPRTLTASSAGSCAVLHDRDNDGDLDLTGLDEIDDWLYFFGNELPPTAVSAAPLGALRSLENSPNPFNPSTLIRFELARAADVALGIFDASGARIATLRNGRFPAGAHDVRWDATDSRGERVGSGVYFCRLEAEGRALVRKLVLLK